MGSMDDKVSSVSHLKNIKCNACTVYDNGAAARCTG